VEVRAVFAERVTRGRMGWHTSTTMMEDEGGDGRPRKLFDSDPAMVCDGCQFEFACVCFQCDG